MKKILLYTLVIGLLASISACQDDYEVGSTAAEAMAGDWWVDMVVTDTEGTVLADYGYYELSTYNTSANGSDSIWLTDKETFWAYKVKVGVDLNNLTFSVDQGKDVIWDDDTTIKNGKIIPGGATSPSGIKTDSIYFEVEWASDPGYIYVGSGYRYTGWAEDDH